MKIGGLGQVVEQRTPRCVSVRRPDLTSALRVLILYVQAGVWRQVDARYKCDRRTTALDEQRQRPC